MRDFKLSIIFIIVLSAVFFGCATSSGTLFKDTVQSKSTSKTDNSRDESSSYTEPEDPEEGLTITSDPSGAEVYVDRSYQGKTPLTLTLESGRYRVTLKKEGYYSKSRWVEYTEGALVNINFPLKQITGYLYLTAYPPETEVEAASFDLSQGVNELPIGKYTINADLFGYDHFSTDVTIHEKSTTNLIIHMQPSRFSFSPLNLTRKVFNPDNPAGLGTSRITFTVTTYGKGMLSIMSDDGTTIRKHQFEPFSTWEQGFTWNGKDSRGRTVPDGSYRITLSGVDSRGVEKDTETAVIRVDHSLIIKDRNSFSGASGTMFTPTPDTLPMGSFQVDIGSTGHVENSGYRFPTSVALRVVPYGKLEADVTGGIIIQSPADNGYFAGIALKKELIPAGSSPFSLSLIAKGSYLFGTNTDSMTNFTGISVSLPAAVTFGPVTLSAAPDILLSPFRISYESDAYPAGFYLYGYGRGAVIVDFGSAWLALSGALRTTYREGKLNIDYPAYAGGELHWILPGTGVIVSGFISGEMDLDAGYFINAGGSLGLIK
ncbi:MAG: hypothetical protein DRP59_11875 [Spirochaetes bacterium]|nr:MAG: hypothetical protein DRP59_11875 [Spirochaetota bacterium]